MINKYLILFGVIVVMLLIISAYISGKRAGSNAINEELIKQERIRLTKEWAQKYSHLQKELSDKQAKIQHLQNNLFTLKRLLEAKRREKDTIQPPQGVDEIIKRLKALGYEVTKCE